MVRWNVPDTPFPLWYIILADDDFQLVPFARLIQENFLRFSISIKMP